jgi:hypothetical protein
VLWRELQPLERAGIVDITPVIPTSEGNTFVADWRSLERAARRACCARAEAGVHPAASSAHDQNQPRSDDQGSGRARDAFAKR